MLKSAALAVAGVLALAVSSPSTADPFPPYWDGGAGEAVHFPPVAWPAEPLDPVACGATCGDWKPYTRFQNSANDPRVQDPSNGGTAPQNYTNIASSCIDKNLPSIYYSLRQGATEADDVLMFRWRVEQIANTYATGPSAGSFSASNPWNSALWTVLFDLDGSGYRTLAAHLNGSSGSPAEPIDMLAGIYGRIPTQSIDYNNDPTNITLLGHNPTAFVDRGSSRILNFNNALAPSSAWPNGSAETRWDYGTTRAIKVSTRSCTEYFVDYQIPVKMLDASAVGGPKITRSTPLSMMFCTANSLNNPFQKDCSINRAWVADPNKPAPFGDYISFDQTDPYKQPIVREVVAVAPSAASCGSGYALSATVQDTLYVNAQGVVGSSVKSVDFYYYHDANGDGLVNDAGSAWTFAAAANLKAGTLNTWTASWDSSALPRGRYLIGVQAVDDRALVDDGMAPVATDHRTFSYLSPETVAALTPPAGELWFGNPEVVGEQIATAGVDLTINTCGVAPSIVKSVSADVVTAGGEVGFTLTVSNPAANSGALILSSLSDVLPAGFAYKSDSTTGAFGSGEPQVNGQTLTWSGSLAIPQGESRSLSFIATVPSITGTYSNIAEAITSFGPAPIVSEPVQLTVGAARLSIAKTPSAYTSAPGGEITYTLSYRNDSPVNASGVIISDTLPLQLDYVDDSCTGGCTWNAGTRTLSWQVGALAAGSGPFSVTFKAVVQSPYTGPASLANTANIDSNETDPASATTAVFIDSPRPALSLTKTASKTLVDPAAPSPGNQVVFTINYANTGNATASSVTIKDPLPAGFLFVSCTGSCTNPGVGSNGEVRWTIPSLAAGAAGSVTVTAQVTTVSAAAVVTNPATNTASVTASELQDAVEDSADVGVLQSGLQCTDYYLSDRQGFVDTGRTLARNVATRDLSGLSASTVSRFIGSNAGAVEIARFYQEEPVTGTLDFSGGASLSSFLDFSKDGSNVTVTVNIYAYDPADATGDTSKVLIATGSANFTGNSKQTITTTITPGATLPKDRKFLVVFVGTMNNQAQTATTNIGVNASTSSYLRLCALPPPNLVIEKSVDLASVQAVGSSRTLTYTLKYANASGSQQASNAILEDILPTSGVTYASCSFTGSHFSRCLFDGSKVVFDNGAGGGVTIPASGSGTVSVTVNVADDLSGITNLVNTAAIRSDQTSEQKATATTAVQGTSSKDDGAPNLQISKSATPTQLVPGGEVEYTLTVVNTGDKTATNVQVSDTPPVRAYLTYKAGSISGGSSRSDAGVPLTWTIASLPPGSVSQLKFSMSVAASGVPAGLTLHDNTASLTYAGGGTGTASSNTVTVTTSTNPRLALVKTASQPEAPAIAFAPGDEIEYTLAVTNSGSGAASAVRVVDDIPAGTRFSAVTAGSGVFDAINNRVVFEQASLAAGASATFKFTVTLDSVLPAGTTTVTNTASVSASNAAGASDTADSTAAAAPDLQLTKSGPPSVPYPAAVLTAAAEAATELFVSTTAGLEIGQAVRLGETVATITAVSARTLTVDTPVTAASGTPLAGALSFGLSYRNTGNADATGVVLTDTLPAGFGYLDASPAPTSSPASGASGVVTWTLGRLAPDDSGTIRLRVFPTGTTGNLINAAQIALEQTDPTPVNNADSATVAVGGLVVAKRTTTPLRKTGEAAAYSIVLSNTLASPVTGVTVRDLLPQGFSYVAGSGKVGGSTVAPNGGVSDPVPTWSGLTVPANGTLVIEFSALVGADVGSGTYQNAVDVSAPAGIGVTPFDPLTTPDEDVTVVGNDVGLVDGVVFIDRNGNGVFDPAVDSVLPGIRVVIDDGLPNPYAVTTDANGYFSQLLPSGSYTVIVNGALLPAGTVALAPGSTSSTPVTVPGGGQVTDNTGFLTAALPSRTLSGTVFNDNGASGGSAGNGVKDGAEPGTNAGELNVVIVDASNTVLAVAVVGGDGSWTASVTAGTGYVAYITTASPTVGSTASPAALLPSGWLVSGEGDATANGIRTAINASADVSGLDFGIASCDGSARVSGRIWLDADRDNIKGDGEALFTAAKVPMLLIPQGDTPGAPRIVLASGGEYAFTGLAPGSYLLQVQDANLNRARALYPTASSLFFSELPACAPVTKDFGYADPAGIVLSGKVWLDVNGDGKRNEWFDADGNGKVTPNAVDALDYANWEWLDLNANGKYDQPSDAGELNECGFGSDVAPGNLRLTGPGGLDEARIVGYQGDWRKQPDVANYGVYMAALSMNASLDARAQAISASARCKPLSLAQPAGASRAQARAAAPMRPAAVTPIAAETTCGLTSAPTQTRTLSAEAPIGADMDFGIACPLNGGGLAVNKSVYLGHDVGAGCATAGDSVVVVDKLRTPRAVTWCVSVTNNGPAPLVNPVFDDPGLDVLADPLQNQARFVPVGGASGPLLIGQTRTWYVEDSRELSLVNVVGVSMTPADPDGDPLPGATPVSGRDDAGATFGYVFDPPFGVKVGTQGGQDIIRWTMVWVNDNVVAAENVLITDPPPDGMTAVGGTLVCTPSGTTTVDSCTFEPPSPAFPRGRVRVIANFGPDFGVTLGSIDTAPNRLEIRFDARIDRPAEARTYENQGFASWDPPGDEGPLDASTYDRSQLSGLDPDTPPSLVDPVDVPPNPSPAPVISPPRPIPALSPLALAGLCMLLMLGALRLRRRGA